MRITELRDRESTREHIDRLPTPTPFLFLCQFCLPWLYAATGEHTRYVRRSETIRGELFSSATGRPPRSILPEIAQADARAKFLPNLLDASIADIGQFQIAQCVG